MRAVIARSRLAAGMRRRVIPLRRVAALLPDGRLRSFGDERFLFTGVEVLASAREVHRWGQPLCEATAVAAYVLLCQLREGALLFLLQVRAEVGLHSQVELGPSIQCSDALCEYDEMYRGRPPLVDEWRASRDVGMLASCVQSEEGGRFLRAMHALEVVMLSEYERVSTPENYVWMSLGEVSQLLLAGKAVSNELRSLIACLLSVCK
jgi:oxidase EvaA